MNTGGGGSAEAAAGLAQSRLDRSNQRGDALLSRFVGTVLDNPRVKLGKESMSWPGGVSSGPTATTTEPSKAEGSERVASSQLQRR